MYNKFLPEYLHGVGGNISLNPGVPEYLANIQGAEAFGHFDFAKRYLRQDVFGDNPWGLNMGRRPVRTRQDIAGAQYRAEQLVAFDSILKRDNRGICAHQWFERGNYTAIVKRLHGVEDKIHRSHFCRIVGGVHFDHKFAVRTNYFQTVGSDGLKVFTPGNQ